MIALWLLTIEALSDVALPYANEVPYSTCESLASFVVQLIVAPDAVIIEAVTLEMTGGVVSPLTTTVTPALVV